jgi:hypothetical protein
MQISVGLVRPYTFIARHEVKGAGNETVGIFCNRITVNNRLHSGGSGLFPGLLKKRHRKNQVSERFASPACLNRAAQTGLASGHCQQSSCAVNFVMVFRLTKGLLR